MKSNLRYNKTIFLLIGPKGSGKSFIGNLFEDNFGIPFIRVEEWVLNINQPQNIFDNSYAEIVFEIIEKGIENELIDKKKLVFESTGLTHYFDKMLTRFLQKFNVITIKVNTMPELCMQRVKLRDQAIHINISDESLKQINRKVSEKRLSCLYQIDNNCANENQLIEKIQEIVEDNE